MTSRISLKIRQPTGDRFLRYKRGDESQTEAMQRLLDDADAPELLRCSECDDAVSTHVRDGEDTIFCPDCAGVDASQVP